jgi:hypothetical protein
MAVKIRRKKVVAPVAPVVKNKKVKVRVKRNKNSVKITNKVNVVVPPSTAAASASASSSSGGVSSGGPIVLQLPQQGTLFRRSGVFDDTDTNFMGRAAMPSHRGVMTREVGMATDHFVPERPPMVDTRMPEPPSRVVQSDVPTAIPVAAAANARAPDVQAPAADVQAPAADVQAPAADVQAPDAAPGLAPVQAPAEDIPTGLGQAPIALLQDVPAARPQAPAIFERGFQYNGRLAMEVQEPAREALGNVVVPADLRLNQQVDDRVRLPKRGVLDLGLRGRGDGNELANNQRQMIDNTAVGLINERGQFPQFRAASDRGESMLQLYENNLRPGRRAFRRIGDEAPQFPPTLEQPPPQQQPLAIQNGDPFGEMED